MIVSHSYGWKSGLQLPDAFRYRVTHFFAYGEFYKFILRVFEVCFSRLLCGRIYFIIIYTFLTNTSIFQTGNRNNIYVIFLTSVCKLASSCEHHLK